MRKDDDFIATSSCLLLADLENYPPLNIDKNLMVQLMKHTSFFSYKRVYVLIKNNQIIAALLYLDKKSKFDEKKVINVLSTCSKFNLDTFNQIKNGYFLPILDFHEDYYIVNIGVRKNEQSKGYGKLLLNYFLKKFKDKTISLECLANNTQAFTFYSSLGFIYQYRFKTYSFYPSDMTSYHMIKSSSKEKNKKTTRLALIFGLFFLTLIILFLILIFIFTILRK